MINEYFTVNNYQKFYIFQVHCLYAKKLCEQTFNVNKVFDRVKLKPVLNSFYVIVDGCEVLAIIL